MNAGAISFITIFGLSLMLGIFIFILGKRSEVKPRPVHNGGGIIKFMPYSCGENFPFDLRSRINLERFMMYAIYFLIFDIAAFILAISFNLLSIAVIVYSALILASISLIVKR